MTTPFPFVAGQVLTAQQLNDIQNLPISDKTASYTLVAGDETKRTIMNNASATTITVNNSIFTVGDVIQIANKGAGTCTITAGAGVTINTSGSLALAQYGGGYLLALSASTFTFFNLGGTSYGIATGGSSSSITIGSINYTLLSFTTDSNLVVTKSGLFDVLLVAGGGGAGGARASRASGGAGGGGVLGLTTTTTIYLDAATYAVDVGAGGTGGATTVLGQTGFDSSIGGTRISVAGGGAGAEAQTNHSDVIGASNGGVTDGNAAKAKTIAAAQGNLGGGSTTSTNAGGGGGFGGAGGNGATTTGGTGGNGAEINGWIGGASYFVAAGAGGGGTVTGGTAGSGGVAGKTTGTGNNGVNYGAGGGGTAQAFTGGNGQAGVVYVRFKV